MPRHPRIDGPDTWHHVMNRGLARRTIFESEHDIRTFLSRLALAVRAGLLEVHAFCFLTTHFHLLVRSPEGELSNAMQRVQNEYSRWFNRARRRDGPLFRSRFRSRCVQSIAYREHLVRYIDFNAVSAGLVETPGLYPHGSARWYAQPRGPIWMCRAWIEETVRRSGAAGSCGPREYASVFGEPVSAGLARLIERRIELSKEAEDPLDDLLGAARGKLLDWMRRKAQLADGTSVGLPVCDPDDVARVIAEARSAEGDWRVAASRKSVCAWPQLQTALLRDLCGSSWEEIGTRTGVSLNGARKAYQRHRDCIGDLAEYGERSAVLAAQALGRCYRTVPRANG